MTTTVIAHASNRVPLWLKFAFTAGADRTDERAALKRGIGRDRRRSLNQLHPPLHPAAGSVVSHGVSSPCRSLGLGRPKSRQSCGTFGRFRYGSPVHYWGELLAFYAMSIVANPKTRNANSQSSPPFFVPQVVAVALLGTRAVGESRGLTRVHFSSSWGKSPQAARPKHKTATLRCHPRLGFERTDPLRSDSCSRDAALRQPTASTPFWSRSQLYSG